MLVVIEGIDKSGKHSQAEKLKDALYVNTAPLLLSFPRYDTPIGKMIRWHLKMLWKVTCFDSSFASGEEFDAFMYTKGLNGETQANSVDAMAFQALMLADKCLVASRIRERQLAHLYTICDRWWQSAVCYGSADGLDAEELETMHDVLPQADLNILIDTPVDVALARGRTGRPDDPDRYEKDKAKLEMVRKNYLSLWKRESFQDQWVVIDGTLPLDEIHQRILNLVRSEEGRP